MPKVPRIQKGQEKTKTKIESRRSTNRRTSFPSTKKLAMPTVTPEKKLPNVNSRALRDALCQSTVADTSKANAQNARTS